MESRAFEPQLVTDEIQPISGGRIAQEARLRTLEPGAEVLDNQIDVGARVREDHEIIREYPRDDVHRLHGGDQGVGDDSEEAHRPWAPLGNAAGALSFYAVDRG